TTYNTSVDVCAPGLNVATTIYNNSYFVFGYTSFASPLAASTAALIRAHYPTLNALQAGERLRVTSEDIYPLNHPMYQDKLGFGRINMLRALTILSPAIRLKSYTLTDGGDNVIRDGETADMVGLFKNFLDPASNVTVTLSTTDPYITISSATATLGAFATLQEKDNSGSPFQFTVSPMCPLDREVEFKLSFSDGLYSDFEYFRVVINPSYLNITVNNTHTTATSNGLIGYTDYPTNTRGLGFQVSGSNSHLFEAGFLFATSATKVSDCVRNGPSQDKDFVSTLSYRKRIPLFAADEGYSVMQDTGINKNDIEVLTTTYAFSASPNQNYVIWQYRIKNIGASTITNGYAGVMADWDIGSDYSKNFVTFDSLRRLGYAYDLSQSAFCGISALTREGFHVYSDTAGTSFSFTNAAKFSALTGGTTFGHRNITGTGKDVFHFVSVGPFDIAPGDSHTVAFAVIGATNKQSLLAAADSAYLTYRCLIAPNTNPKVNFTVAETVISESAAMAPFDCRNAINIPLTINLTTSLSEELRLYLKVRGGTAKDTLDYRLVDSVLTFSPGQTTGNFVVKLLDDHSIENNDTLLLDFYLMGAKNVDPGCSLFKTQLIIQDNDAVTEPLSVQTGLTTTTVYFGPQDSVLVTVSGNILTKIKNLLNYDY
ncbi:MAG: hypothetical protein NZ108_07290, partial [Bacteroidia bacterium]|nr:hypothetical protein [Bacteroidia bacterium]